MARIEKKLRRAVNKAEFGTPELIQELQVLYQPEYEKLLDLVEDSGIMILK